MFKVGDKVITSNGEIGEVFDVDGSLDYTYPICIVIDNKVRDKRFYTKDGKKRIVNDNESIKLYVETEREYKVGDKIRIPHAEELLLKGWKVDNNRLEYNSGVSCVEVSWCGKDIMIEKVGVNSLYLKEGDKSWVVNPEHLGLPSVKPTPPEPKVGEFYRVGRYVYKIISDRKLEIPGWGGYNRFVGMNKSGALYPMNLEDCTEKVNGWEGR